MKFIIIIIPNSDNPYANDAAVVVLPTPPLPDVTTTTLPLHDDADGANDKLFFNIRKLLYKIKIKYYIILYRYVIQFIIIISILVCYQFIIIL